MSGPLRYAATHFPEMVDVPSDYPPMTEEEIQRFKEICRELAELAARDIAEKAGERFEDEDEEDEYEEKEVTMSGPLAYAATHFPEMVDIPSAHYPPTTEEDMRKLDEISRELAELSSRAIAEKAGERFEDEDEGEEEEKETKQRQHRPRTHGRR